MCDLQRQLLNLPIFIFFIVDFEGFNSYQTVQRSIIPRFNFSLKLWKFKDFKKRLQIINDEDDGSKEFRTYIWRKIFDCLQNINEDDLLYIDKEITVKFLFASLQRYVCNTHHEKIYSYA